MQTFGCAYNLGHCMGNKIGSLILHSDCNGTSEQAQFDIWTTFLVCNAVDIKRISV